MLTKINFLLDLVYKDYKLKKLKARISLPLAFLKLSLNYRPFCS